MRITIKIPDLFVRFDSHYISMIKLKLGKINKIYVLFKMCFKKGERYKSLKNVILLETES